MTAAVFKNVQTKLLDRVREALIRLVLIVPLIGCLALYLTASHLNTGAMMRVFSTVMTAGLLLIPMFACLALTSSWREE